MDVEICFDSDEEGSIYRKKRPYNRRVAAVAVVPKVVPKNTTRTRSSKRVQVEEPVVRSPKKQRKVLPAPSTVVLFTSSDSSSDESEANATKSFNGPIKKNIGPTRKYTDAVHSSTKTYSSNRTGGSGNRVNQDQVKEVTVTVASQAKKDEVVIAKAKKYSSTETGSGNQAKEVTVASHAKKDDVVIAKAKKYSSTGTGSGNQANQAQGKEETVASHAKKDDVVIAIAKAKKYSNTGSGSGNQAQGKEVTVASHTKKDDVVTAKAKKYSNTGSGSGNQANQDQAQVKGVIVASHAKQDDIVIAKKDKDQLSYREPSINKVSESNTLAKFNNDEESSISSDEDEQNSSYMFKKFSIFKRKTFGNADIGCKFKNVIPTPTVTKNTTPHRFELQTRKFGFPIQASTPIHGITKKVGSLVPCITNTTVTTEAGIQPEEMILPSKNIKMKTRVQTTTNKSTHMEKIVLTDKSTYIKPTKCIDQATETRKLVSAETGCMTDPAQQSSKSVETDTVAQQTVATTTDQHLNLVHSSAQTEPGLLVNERSRRKSPSPELQVGEEGQAPRNDGPPATATPRQAVYEIIQTADLGEAVYAHVDEDMAEYRRLGNSELQNDVVCFTQREVDKQVSVFSPKDGFWEEIYPNVFSCGFVTDTGVGTTNTMGYITIEQGALRPFEEVNADGLEGPFVFTVIKGSVTFKTNLFTVEDDRTFLTPILVQKGGSIVIERGMPYSFENRSTRVAKLVYFVK